MKNGVVMQYFEWNLPNNGKLWQELKRDASYLHEIRITPIGKNHQGEVWHEIAGNRSEEITIDEEGNTCFLLREENWLYG